jgi:hypothetical protein
MRRPTVNVCITKYDAATWGQAGPLSIAIRRNDLGDFTHIHRVRMVDGAQRIGKKPEGSKDKPGNHQCARTVEADRSSNHEAASCHRNPESREEQ